MGRPKNNSAEYFSHDADMRNDVKVKALRRRFSHTGYAVWNYILETLTDSENFELDFRDVNRELLAADYELSVEELTEIVEYACRIDLLQMSEDGTVLFSAAHKRRFAQLLERRSKLSQAGKKGMASRWNNANEDITPNKEVITQDSKEKETKVKESKGKKIEYPYQDIVAMWNSVCLSCPKVIKVTEARKQKMKTRFQEFGVKREELTDYVMRLFQRVQASDFLTGRSTDKMGWVANFDWVFENEKNWIKVSEGNYDNKRGGGSNTAQKPVQAADGSQVQLGVGEYIDGSGRRTYGTGRANIPMTAAHTPTER